MKISYDDETIGGDKHTWDFDDQEFYDEAIKAVEKIRKESQQID